MLADERHSVEGLFQHPLSISLIGEAKVIVNQNKWKSTSTLISFSMGWPSLRAGVNFQRLTASTAFSSRAYPTPTVRDEPTPEVSALARSPDCSPSAAEDREVQKNDRVRRSKPNLDSVVETEVAIQDPFSSGNKLLLNDHPLITRRCNKPWPPEDLVKLDDREAGDLAQTSRQSRFS
jgi:hypothetical protein